MIKLYKQNASLVFDLGGGTKLLHPLNAATVRVRGELFRFQNGVGQNLTREVPFTELAREDGSPWGASPDEVLDNLTSELGFSVSPPVVEWGDITGNIALQTDLAANFVKKYARMPIVSSKAELEALFAPVAGVITIPSGVFVFFVGDIDLGTNRLLFEADAGFAGTSSETSSLTSSLGTGQALISALGSLPARDIALFVTPSTIGATPQVLDIDGVAEVGAALDWLLVNIVGSKVGSIRNYNNVVFNTCAFLGSDGLTFSGVFGSVVFETSLLQGSAGKDIIVFDAATTINRRIRFSKCSIIVAIAGTGINLPLTASVPIEGYIMDLVNFSGLGAPIAGVQPRDNKSLFLNVRGTGITNSAELAVFYMVNNATNTNIVTANVFADIQGTAIAGAAMQRFTLQNNMQVTFTGALTRVYKVDVLATIITSTPNQNVQLQAYKNGAPIPESYVSSNTEGSGRRELLPMLFPVELAQGDTLKIRVSNSGAGNITVSYLTLFATAVQS